MSLSQDKAAAGGGNASTSTPSSRGYLYVGKYKMIKTIGKGNFARVKLARHMPTGQEVRKETGRRGEKDIRVLGGNRKSERGGRKEMKEIREREGEGERERERRGVREELHCTE